VVQVEPGEAQIHRCLEDSAHSPRLEQILTVMTAVASTTLLLEILVVPSGLPVSQASRHEHEHEQAFNVQPITLVGCGALDA